MDWDLEARRRYERTSFHFKPTENPQELIIGGSRLLFPRQFRGQHGANRWLTIKHRMGKIHEPGLVAWILLITDIFKDRLITFYDIGALYGYFSAIFAMALPHATIVAVEANPRAARYIGELISLNELSNACVKNAVLGQNDELKRFILSGFEIKESGGLFSDVNAMGLAGFIKDVGRGAFAGLGLNHLLWQNKRRVTVRELSLLDVLQPYDPKCMEILKIDLEGYQAKMLPPAEDELIRRSAIILMEFDDPPKLARFGKSNASLCSRFLQAGYSLYWADHRSENFEFVKVSTLTKSQECNSLGVLLPPNVDYLAT